jgi:hypothetical protein
LPEAPADPAHRFGAMAWVLAPEQVRALCERLKAPKRFQQLGEHVAAHGRTLADWPRQDPAALLVSLGAIGALAGQRDPATALAVVQAQAGVDLSGLRELIRRLRAIGSQQFRDQGLSGKALGDAIRAARLDLIRAAQDAI